MVLLIYSIICGVACLCTVFALVCTFNGIVFNEVIETGIEITWFGSFIAYAIFSVFTFIYGLVTGESHLIIISASTIVFGIWVVVSCIFVDRITDEAEGTFLVATAVLFVLWLIINSYIIISGVTKFEYVSREKVVETIDIVSFENASYTNVTGNRFYIKSEPTCSYYYDQKGEDGGIVTRCIDGAKNYVVRYEDSEYENNAHIRVAEVYANNWYGFEIPVRNNYYIYIPKDSVLYV